MRTTRRGPRDGRSASSGSARCEMPRGASAGRSRDADAPRRETGCSFSARGRQRRHLAMGRPDRAGALVATTSKQSRPAARVRSGGDFAGFLDDVDPRDPPDRLARYKTPWRAAATTASNTGWRGAAAGERWVEGKGRVVLDRRTAAPLRMTGVCMDITDAQAGRAAAASWCWTGELRHRVKNMLAVVRSLAAPDAPAPRGSLEAFAAAFQGRLEGLRRRPRSAGRHQLGRAAGLRALILGPARRRLVERRDRLCGYRART